MEYVIENKDVNITPSNGKSIIQDFIDFETNYRIIVEKDLDKNETYSIFDMESLNPISLENRIKALENQIKIIEKDNFIIHTWRTVDNQSGLEIIHQKLFDILDKNQLRYSQEIAFKEEAMSNVIDTYQASKAYNSEYQKKQKEFWAKAYPKYSFQDRVGHWGDYIYKFMRLQVDSGQNDIDIFSENNFLNWKEREPEIKKILKIIVSSLIMDPKDELEINNRLESFN